jgi:acylphosphatase
MTDDDRKTGNDKAGGRKAVNLRIDGRVQGVWYRGWTVEQARARGLDGWVRNRSDGSVEAVVAGPPEAVEEMIALCRRGPGPARVDDVTVKPAADPGPVGFDQVATR